jgi:predicted nucleotidyltransferase
MSHRENITRIKAVYLALEELGPEVVFVGGATVSLYSTRPENETRPTEDVDIVVEIMHYAQYAEIEEKLRNKGFINDTESRVICRYIIHGITVDVMPTSENILGFANKWYPEAFVNSVSVKVEEGISIRLFSAPYFLATKLEAFIDRGENDGRFSSDFEDIVHILNNRQSVWDEIKNANESVRRFLKGEFSRLLDQKYIDEWMSVHLEYSEQRRVGYILGNMNEFVQEQ